MLGLEHIVGAFVAGAVFGSLGLLGIAWWSARHHERGARGHVPFNYRGAGSPPVRNPPPAQSEGRQ